MNTQEQPVTASLVAEAQRLDFLPAYFGPRLGVDLFSLSKVTVGDRALA